VLSDENPNAVDDDIPERERLEDEIRRLEGERQQYLQQPASQPPLVYATATSEHYHNNGENT
jgi:hypothetical protein